MDFCSIAVSILHSRPVLLRGINSCQTEGLVIAGDMEGASVQCVGEKTLDKVSFFLIQACVGVCQAHTPGSRAAFGLKMFLVRHLSNAIRFCQEEVHNCLYDTHSTSL